LFLVSISGRAYPHYYLTLLPSLAIFSGIAFWGISNLILKVSKRNIPMIFFTIIAIGIVLLSGSFKSYRENIGELRNVKDSNNLVQIIQNSSSPNDTILLWGAESAYNFYAQRVSPSKYVYQYPLYTNGYVTQQMIEGFIDDIIQNRPALIIDTKNELTPFLAFPLESEKINSGIQYLKSHYILKGDIGNWTIYEFVKDP
jgi:hypothetical protein